MKRLFLLRHGDASHQGATDADRELTNHGREQARTVGRFLSSKGVELDTVLSSTAARAHEMAEIVCGSLELAASAIDASDGLYLADTTHLVDVISRVDAAARCVLIVGHNPGISDAACYLGNAAIGLGTSGLVEIAFEESWQHAGLGTAANVNVYDPVPRVEPA